MNTLRVFVVGTLFAVVAAVGCTPDYPKCDTDKDCAAKKEFCVANKCQQYRTSSDCQEGFTCNSGRCDKIAGYCQDQSQCPAGQACIGKRCQACKADADCPAGTKCWKGTCDNKKHCSKDDECAQDEDCINGVCSKEGKKPTTPPTCTLGSVYFDFNESALTTEGTTTLARNAECLKKVPNSVTIVGHADPRGTAEYNIALSEKRAQSVQAHLSRLGVEGARVAILPRGSLDARGTNEPTWAQDRRADFTWR